MCNFRLLAQNMLLAPLKKTLCAGLSKLRSQKKSLLHALQRQLSRQLSLYGEKTNLVENACDAAPHLSFRQVCRCVPDPQDLQEPSTITMDDYVLEDLPVSMCKHEPLFLVSHCERRQYYERLQLGHTRFMTANMSQSQITHIWMKTCLKLGKTFSIYCQQNKSQVTRINKYNIVITVKIKNIAKSQQQICRRTGWVWPMTSKCGVKGDHGPLLKSMDTPCRAHVKRRIVRTLSITRYIMEHGGWVPTICALTAYYLPTSPP